MGQNVLHVHIVCTQCSTSGRTVLDAGVGGQGCTGVQQCNGYCAIVDLLGLQLKVNPSIITTSPIREYRTETESFETGLQKKMTEIPQLPKIDFSCVDPLAPGAGDWATVRAQVMDALTSFGCFDAHYPSLRPDLRASLFDDAVKPLFSLPAEIKRQNYYGPDKPFDGYLGGLPGLDAYESLAIRDGPQAESVRAFSELMWPDGNPGFCETVHGAAKHIAQLEELVRRMILEDLGVVKYHEAQSKSMWHLFRMSEYTAPHADETKLGYISHQDTNTLSVVCQHEVDGLEVQTKDGKWILVRPSPTSLIVMAGNAFRAWTNDRVHAPFHRVVIGGNVNRYSAILFSDPHFMIQAPEELVDEDHPSCFTSFNHHEFIRFCVSEEGARHKDKLKAYCGI